MEPLAAIGLAANVVQFLDFARGLVSEAFEIYQAVDGATSSNALLERVTEDLIQICNGLDSTAHERDGGFSNKAEAQLVPLVKILKEQLGVTAKVDGVANILDRLAESHRRLEIASVNQSATLRKEITSSLREVVKEHGKNPGGETECMAFQLPSTLQGNLRQLATTSTVLQRQIEIIESLKFPGMNDREDNIKIAHPGTFTWLLEDETEDYDNDIDEQSKILDWLRTGSGIFWISGKAGSGKSTLMKFFHNHDKTYSTLKDWAGDTRLLVASFFFWNAGNTMQKSQYGLLQTLLYHILKQAPELIASICPTRWQEKSSSSWKQNEITATFTRLKEQHIDFARFCFFIDGLDEYEGDDDDIISTLDELTSSKAIKICCSSRPWNVFERAYGHKDKVKIKLQDLTRDDISRFVEEQLAEGRQTLSLKVHQESYQNLVDEIVDSSDGVFLWVFLVVRSLRRGMTNLDTPVELQSRLRELPTELEAFFQHILDKTDKVYHQQAARLYQICLVARCQISALDVSCFAEQDPFFGLSDRLLALNSSELSGLSNETVVRVKARCQDLLEFTSANLQFLHRTVKDFLETNDISTQLKSRAGANFNPHNFLCNSMLLQIRLKARLSNPTAIHSASFTTKLRSFGQHARNLDDNNELNLTLLTELAKSGKEFSRKLPTEAGWGTWLPSHSLLEESSFHGWYHEGWLADVLAHDGVRNYLSQGIGGTIDIVSLEGKDVKKTPLNIALNHMKGQNRNREVFRLLDEGADPNEEDHGGISEWRRYIMSKSSKSDACPDKCKHKECETSECEIIEALLLHGADPSLAGEKKRYFQILKDMSSKDVRDLEKIRMSLLPSVDDQQQLVDSQQRRPSTHKRKSQNGPYLPSKLNDRDTRKKQRRA
ncbi:uncharacterized protein KY384_007380 [Bacidia gigantensis]|uniref:uncharacterized protein n=1 Tax=Bacidia gigantensis TaxID=2732470 RepID=UPI001D048E7D|nr:uncharacterized protein KY384_007380 [Bacidia gigantensis]KAG8528462.1 hypothetical protein KY384_007380 [Bacidia gigantensis]